MSDGPFRPHDTAPREPGEGAPQAPPSPDPPRPSRPFRGPVSQTTWLMGVAVVLLLAYITVNTLRTEHPGSRGVADGQPLPPFAAPVATSSLEGDANVLLKRRDGVPPACAVRGPDVVNSCELAEQAPAVLAFLATRSERCVAEIDVLDSLRRRFPDVRFAAVAIRGDREDVRSLVRSHRWGMPVAHDRDGAVANAYAVAVCPTITFIDAHGRVAHTTLGEADRAELIRRLEEIS